ncbi:MAG: hypothetical protein ACLU90_05075 [Lachnospira sp.]
MSNVYGIDIGTSNFKMCCKDKDAILNEKNIIAIANKKIFLLLAMKHMKCMKRHQRI